MSFSYDESASHDSGASEERSEFSLKTLEYIMQPKNFEEMDSPDGIAIIQGQCGDRMAFFIKMEGDVLKRATFVTDGCGATVACGSALSQIVTGKGLNEAFSFSADNLLSHLGGLPSDHEHCAALAVRTLRTAILNYRERIKDRTDD